MIVLDEDLSDSQIAARLGRYPGVRFLSDLMPTGLDDADVVDRLASQKDMVFVTNNTRDFWYRFNAPSRVCIMCVDVDTKDAETIATLIRKTIALDEFDTHLKRGGLTLRVSTNRIRWYRDRTKQDKAACNAVAFEL